MSLQIRLCRTLLYAGIVLFLFAPVCSAQVLLDNGQLYVQIEGRPLQAILEEIGRQGNITIQIKGTLSDQRMSMAFGPLPLEKGLKRILKKTNYLAIYDNDGKIIKLVILGSMPMQSSRPSPKLQTAPAISVAPPDVVEPNEQHPATPESPENKEEGKKGDQNADGNRPAAPSAGGGPKEGT
ncbi:MAG: hypothetical protein P4L42_15275 [Desulfocapsaceae bacterium]|nr:hypothetical protein [Desulfocapsaceae bacterium]